MASLQVMSMCIHCCRPQYLALANLRQEYPGVPVVAVTATATSAVITEISDILGLKQPKVLIGSFNRPNIQYSVRQKELIGDGSDAAVVQVQTQPALCSMHSYIWNVCSSMTRGCLAVRPLLCQDKATSTYVH